MDPAVVPEHHVVRVGGIDPQRVVVHVDALHPVGGEGPPAVLGVVHLGSEHPDALVVVGVDADLAVVHRTRIRVAHPLPGEPLVLGTEDAALPVLDDRVDDAGIPAIDVEADPPGVAVGQSATQLHPGIPAVGGAMDPASRAAARKAVGAPPPLVERRVDDVRAFGIHGEFHRAGVLVTVKHPVPGLAPVTGPIDTALVVRAPQVTKRRDVDGSGIGGMHEDPADVVGVLETLVGPGGPAVVGDVDPVAPGAALPVRRFAGAHPHHRGIRGRNRDGADRGHLLVLELRNPGDPVVLGFPDSRRSSADPEDLGVGLDDRDVVDATSHDRRSDVPPLDPVQDRFDLLGGLGSGRRCRQQQDCSQQEPGPGTPAPE